MNLTEIPEWVQRDPEWRAAIHLLRSRMLRAKNVMRYVDFDRRTIGFPELAAASGPWSHAERIMVHVAWCLFNGGGTPGDQELLVDALSTLDEVNMVRVLQAIILRRPDLAEPMREWLKAATGEAMDRADP